MRISCLAGFVLCLVVSGCASNAPATQPPPGPSGPQGALAGLDARSAREEMWTLENGGPMPFLSWAQPQLKVSASCRKPDGTLDCEAIRFLKGGMPVEIAHRSMTGRMSAGTMVCMKLKYPLSNGKNPLGVEDGFCKFPDGSITTTGALEQYNLRVIE